MIAYLHGEAIADGVLVAVDDKLGREARLNVQVDFTSEVYERYVH